MGTIVVMTTVGTEQQANIIARELVDRRHAACVNVVQGIRSIYRWKGRVCRDSELLLIIKTMEEEYELVSSTIKELHNYELPEILAFPVSRGDDAFQQWIAGCLDKDAKFVDEDDDVDELPNTNGTGF